MFTVLAGFLINASVISPPESTFVIYHPHFPRKVEVSLGMGREAEKVSVSHLTVTLDEEGFKKAAPGFSWHLANARLTTSRPLKVGGVTLKPGEHSIRARKNDDGTWSLLSDSPQRFARKATKDARALRTEFIPDSHKMEHMTIDIHPSGDKSETTLWLVVHMGSYIARSLVELED